MAELVVRFLLVGLTVVSPPLSIISFQLDPSPLTTQFVQYISYVYCIITCIPPTPCFRFQSQSQGRPGLTLPSDHRMEQDQPPSFEQGSGGPRQEVLLARLLLEMSRPPPLASPFLLPRLIIGQAASSASLLGLGRSSQRCKSL